MDLEVDVETEFETEIEVTMRGEERVVSVGTPTVTIMGTRGDMPLQQDVLDIFINVCKGLPFKVEAAGSKSAVSADTGSP